MFKSKCDVSVVIPCYKSIKTIERAVYSISQQTVLPSEIILVDDFSPDETLSHLYFLKNKFSFLDIDIIVVKLLENKGAGSARNNGWDLSTKKYIAFLDSDDSWHPQKLEIQYAFMERNPDIALSSHNCLEVIEAQHKKLDMEASLSSFKEISSFQLLVSNRFSTPTVMLKRDLDFRFQEGKRYAEDYQLWLEILLSKYKCYKTDLHLAYLYKARYGSSGLSADLWRMEKGELLAYREVFKKKLLGFYFAPFLYTFSMLKFLKRQLLSIIK